MIGGFVCYAFVWTKVENGMSTSDWIAALALGFTAVGMVITVVKWGNRVTNSTENLEKGQTANEKVLHRMEEKQDAFFEHMEKRVHSVEFEVESLHRRLVEVELKQKYLHGLSDPEVKVIRVEQEKTQ